MSTDRLEHAGVRAGPNKPKAQDSTGRRWARRGGCSLLVLLALFGAVLIYLEEVVSYHGLGTEIASQPITSGQEFEIFVETDWLNYARVRAYVDVGANADMSIPLAGEMGCMNFGELRLQSVQDSQYLNAGLPQDALPPGWIPVWETSKRSDGRPLQCRGTFTMTPTATAPRVVFTRQQRPSGFFAF